MIDRHFTATGIVFNNNVQVLLIRHRKLGVWLPPGGHIEANETPDAAVLREIFEETGIVASFLPNGEITEAEDQYAKVLAKPFCVFDEDIRAEQKHFHIDLMYLCRLQSGILRENPQESQGIAWFSETEIPQLESYHNAKTVLLQAFAHVKKKPQLLAPSSLE